MRLYPLGHEKPKRKRLTGELTKQLPNDIVVKGCYKYSMSGCFMDIYVICPMGYIIGFKNFAVKGVVEDPQAALIRGVDIMMHFLKRVGADKATKEDQDALVAKAITIGFPRKTLVNSA